MQFEPLLLADVTQAGVLNFALRALILAGAVFLGARFLSGVHLRDFGTAFAVALTIALLNATLGSVLDFFTAPLRWITLGLFSLVVDAIIIVIADKIFKGFEVRNFWWAVGLAIIIALVNALLGPILTPGG